MLSVARPAAVALIVAVLVLPNLLSAQATGEATASGDWVSRAQNNGGQLGRRAWQEQQNFVEGKEFSEKAGVIVAEGDSWFSYPFRDVLKYLERDHHYRVEDVAHHGDTVESMAYDPYQLTDLASTLYRLAKLGKKPRAILLSGGGNDLAGPELAMLLNHKGSGKSVLRGDVVKDLIRKQLRDTIVSLISAISVLNKAAFNDPGIPILIHGYSFPVPDGRGFWGGFWALPGPWLAPSFSRKGYNLSESTKAMHDLIEEFNTVLQDIATTVKMPPVHYVDLRDPSILSAGPGYKNDWENELHPTRRGFRAVAEEFAKAIPP